MHSVGIMAGCRDETSEGMAADITVAKSGLKHLSMNNAILENGRVEKGGGGGAQGMFEMIQARPRQVVLARNQLGVRKRASV